MGPARAFATWVLCLRKSAVTGWILSLLALASLVLWWRGASFTQVMVLAWPGLILSWFSAYAEWELQDVKRETTSPMAIRGFMWTVGVLNLLVWLMALYVNLPR